MPYNPGIQYRGDQYLYGAISGLGEAAGKAIKQYRDEKREGDAATSTFETMMQAVRPMVESGAIPEGLAKEFQDAGKFAGMSLSQKKAKLGSLVTSFGMLMQDRQFQETKRRNDELTKYRNDELRLQRDAADERKAVRKDTMGAIAGTADNEGDAAVFRDNPNADPGILATHLDRQAAAAARKREAWKGPGAPIDLGDGNKFVFTSANSGQVVQPKTTKEQEVKLEVGTDAFGQPRVSFSGPPEKVAEKVKAMGLSMPSSIGTGAAGAGKPGQQSFAPGQRVRQNGVLYEYDGKAWKPVQ